MYAGWYVSIDKVFREYQAHILEEAWTGVYEFCWSSVLLGVDFKSTYVINRDSKLLAK